MKKLSLLAGVAVVLSAWFWWAARPPSSIQEIRSEVGASVVSAVVTSVAEEATTEQKALPERPEERLLASATTLETRETSMETEGRVQRVRLMEAAHGKYPLIRVEETWQGERLAQRVMMVADHILVKVHDGVTREQLAAVVSQRGDQIRRALRARNVYLVSFSNPTVDTVLEKAEAYRKESDVVRLAGPDGIPVLTAIPNDPSYTNL